MLRFLGPSLLTPSMDVDALYRPGEMQGPLSLSATSGEGRSLLSRPPQVSRGKEVRHLSLALVTT